MSFHSDNSGQPLLTPELSDILDKYASPASSVSSRKPRRKDHGSVSIHRGSSASVVSTHSSTLRIPSTNSGYLRRSELFGQVSPKPVLEPVDMSRALSYFHDSPSPIGRPSSLHERQSSRSLRTHGALASSSLSIHSSRSTGPHLLADVASGEDATGVDSSILNVSAYGAGSAVRSKKGFSFPATKNHFYNKSSDVLKDGTRKISPAQEALLSVRTTAFKPTTPRHTRKSSWATRLFGRFSSSQIAHPRSSFSDDNISDFEYVEPHNSSESPEAILDHIRAKGTALKQQSSEASLSSMSTFRSELDDDEHYTEGRLPESASMGDSVSTGEMTPADASMKLPAPDATGDERMSTGADVLRFPETDAHSETSTLGSTSLLASLEPQFSVADDLSGQAAQNHGEGVYSEAQTAGLELSPVVVISSQPSTLTKQRLSFSTWSTIIDQVPQTPEYDLSLSPVKPTFIQHHIMPPSRKGLTFVAANAIIHGSMTFATILYIIRHIDEDLTCGEMGSDMAYAFLAALVLCVVLYVDLLCKILAGMEGLLAVLGLNSNG